MIGERGFSPGLPEQPHRRQEVNDKEVHMGDWMTSFDKFTAVYLIPVAFGSAFRSEGE